MYYKDMPPGQVEGNGEQVRRFRRRHWRPSALLPVTEQGSEAGPISEELALVDSIFGVEL